MTSFLGALGDLEARISATAALPVDQQAEALVALFQTTDRAAMAPFVALLIGEVVTLRALRRPPPRPAPAPALAAS